MTPAAGAVRRTALPGIARRLACFLYEGVVLFGILFVAGYLYSSLTQQRHALQGQEGLQAFLFLVLGIYFGWFWSHGRQTVAMRAWHLRIVDTSGQPISQARAIGRYLLSWLWFAPALLTLHLAGLHGAAAIASLLLAGIACYAAVAAIHPQRQFLHDLACGTQVVDSREEPVAQSGG